MITSTPSVLVTPPVGPPASYNCLDDTKVAITAILWTTLASELILKRQLHNARIARSQNTAKIQTVQRGCGVVRVHMIGEVEHFPAELQGVLLIQLKSASQTGIEREARRTLDVGDAQIPVGSEGRLCKGCRVEPQIEALLTYVGRLTDAGAPTIRFSP